jgi:hypothetical protein
MAQRKRTLPIGSAGEPPPKVQIDDAQWLRLEKTLESTISSKLRVQLVDATNQFLHFATFKAEPIAGSIQRIKSVSDAAIKFRQALIEAEGGDAKFDTRLFADRLIQKHFHDPRIKDRNKIRKLADIMTSFVVACEKANTEIDDVTFAERRSVDGWQTWIRRLTEILDRHKLPTSARKDRDKNKTGKASPFVSFVKLFQECFDERFRRGTPSSLAEAITLARRVPKSHEKQVIKTRKPKV